MTDAHDSLEERECSGYIALAEGQQTRTPQGYHEARGVIHRLRNPQPFVPKGKALGERPQLGTARGKEGAGGDGGEERTPERSRCRVL